MGKEAWTQIVSERMQTHQRLEMNLRCKHGKEQEQVKRAIVAVVKAAYRLLLKVPSFLSPAVCSEKLIFTAWCKEHAGIDLKNCFKGPKFQSGKKNLHRERSSLRLP